MVHDCKQFLLNERQNCYSAVNVDLPLKLLWKTPILKPFAYTPLFCNGKGAVFSQHGVGRDNHESLSIFSLETGETLWEKTFKNIYLVHNYFLGDSSIIIKGDDFIEAFSMENGTPLWGIFIGKKIHSMTKINNYAVYRYPEGLGVVDLDKKIIMYEINCPRPGSVSFYKGNLYFGTEDNLFCCINAEFGKVIWKNDFKCLTSYEDIVSGEEKVGYLYRHGPFIDDNRIFITPRDRLCALDAETGEVLWINRDTVDYIYNRFKSIAVKGNRLYGFSGEELFCFDVGTGMQIFRKGGMKVSKKRHASPIFVTNNVVFCGGVGLYAFCTERGTLLWEYYPPNMKKAASIFTSHPVYSEGRLLASCEDGHLYCFLTSANGQPVTVTH